MSVLSVTELPQDESDEEGPKLNGQRVFRVRVSAATDGRAEIIASGLIPAPFSIYQGMFLKLRTFSRGKGLKTWIVRCQYSTDTTQREQDLYTNPNPVNRPCVVDLVTLREQVPAQKGRDGKALVNVLGRPYDPPLMRWRTRLRFECERNVLASLGYPTWFFNLADCLNEDPFEIRGAMFDEKTLLFCTDRIPDRQVERIGGVDIAYYACGFAIEWTPEGWDPEVLQADVYQVGDGVDGLVRITEDGVPVSTPRKLNEMGQVIDSDDPDEAFYETEEIQLLADFSVLTAVMS